MLTNKLKVVDDEMAAILGEIPSKLAIPSVMREAHARIVALMERELTEAERSDLNNTHHLSKYLADKLAEVLREIATHAVEEFTSRTKQPFLWVDEPPIEDDMGDVIMRFALDENGHLAFDNRPVQEAPEPSDRDEDTP